MSTLKHKIHESLSSVLPISIIVLLSSITITPLPLSTMLLFLVGVFMLIVGMGFFSLGVDMSMIPIGENVGRTIQKHKKMVVSILLILIIGVFITLAEPDLVILAQQIPNIEDAIIIWAVAIGVSCMLLLSYLKNRYAILLRTVLVVLFGLVFLLLVFVPPSFISVIFDSGGVTTGPILVPFLMALGIGIRKKEEDSFGLVSLVSIGAILAVLILSIIYQPEASIVDPFEIVEVFTTQDIMKVFLSELPFYLFEILKALSPILLFFISYQAVTHRFSKRSIIKILIGLLYSYIGLVLFLCGVNVGFMPAGYLLGYALASLSYNWILVPIGMIIGYYIVKAEPAVYVLIAQVEELTSGAISQKAMFTSLSIGVSLSVGISMLRVLTGIPLLFFLIVGYGLALLLSFKVKPLFQAIAFDSGGVASGPMSATFLLPLAMGASVALQGNILSDAFGIVALVAMTPIVTIQLLGYFMLHKSKPKNSPEVDNAVHPKEISK